MKHHVFEVPYNFDKNFINELKKYPEYFKYIKFIYLPAFKENGIKNTREIKYKEYELYTNLTFYQYSNIINEIKSLSIDVCILLQRGATLDIINKYINELNIKYFVINDDTLAKQLKQIYGDKIYLILSITRIISENEIHNKDLSMYDEICLYFWFNKHLNAIKNLPKKYKYSILVNSRCVYDCKQAILHWFIKPGYTPCVMNENKTIMLKPEDLIYFVNFIDSFKLQDRTASTSFIIDHFITYTNAYKNINNLEYNIERMKHFDIDVI